MVEQRKYQLHRNQQVGVLDRQQSGKICLEFELKELGLKVEKEVPMPIVYKDVKLDHGYRMDLLVEGKIVIELKTVEAFTNVHTAQVLTYLRLGNYKLGLLINFQVSVLKDGIKRIIN